MTIKSQKERKSFIIHKDSLEILDRLSDEQAGKLFKAIYRYQTTGEEAHEELWVSLALHPFLTGFKKSEEASRKGQYHWNWQNGKSSETAIIRQSSDNKSWRASVFQRDGYTCQKCLQKGKRLHAHHKKEFSKYPELRFEISNGITLCVECHRYIHSKAFNRSEPTGFF